MLFKKEADKLYSKLEVVSENGKIVCYKKRKVFPIFDMDGKINWFNLLTGGSWIRLGLILGGIAIILLCIYDWAKALDIGNKCLEILNDNKLSFLIKQ